MTNTQRHIEKLYITGKTTFRDDQLLQKDYVVKMNDLVASWALVNVELVEQLLMMGDFLNARNSFDEYATNELKQLCIDYYGDE